MESIGRLAGGVAHDFNNMLQAILGNAALALQAAPPAPVGEYLNEIRHSAERSADLTRQLLAFASRQTATPRVLDLNDTISGMLKMLVRLIGEDIHLQWAPGRAVWPIKMDPSQLDQILANLAVNARDAIGGVGTLTIETANITCREDDCEHGYRGCRRGDYATLTVCDTGSGMSEDTLSHIFEPFFTTKKPGQGVGLGLATVFGVVKQNRGFISVKSTPGHGATFVIGIPRAAIEHGAPTDPEPRPAALPLRRGSETILLVEDEKAILRLGEESLRRLGYRILAALTPQQAVDLARQHTEPIHLLITDVVLPEMNGRELALLMSSLHPEVRCLFMSGYTADVIAERGVLDEHVHFLQKPFTLDALAAAVRKVLDEDAHA
jgi:CheY-like chemotaxis protein